MRASRATLLSAPFPRSEAYTVSTGIMSASPAASDYVSQGGETPIVEEPRCGVMSDVFLLLNRIGHDALFRSGLWQVAFVRCSFGELFDVVAIQPCASANVCF